MGHKHTVPAATFIGIGPDTVVHSQGTFKVEHRTSRAVMRFNYVNGVLNDASDGTAAVIFLPFLTAHYLAGRPVKNHKKPLKKIAFLVKIINYARQLPPGEDDTIIMFGMEYLFTVLLEPTSDAYFTTSSGNYVGVGIELAKRVGDERLLVLARAIAAKAAKLCPSNNHLTG